MVRYLVLSSTSANLSSEHRAESLHRHAETVAAVQAAVAQHVPMNIHEV
jgi:hypothetical protein